MIASKWLTALRLASADSRSDSESRPQLGESCFIKLNDHLLDDEVPNYIIKFTCLLLCIDLLPMFSYTKLYLLFVLCFFFISP